VPAELPPIVPQPVPGLTASGLAWASFFLGLASVLGVVLFVAIVLAHVAGLDPEAVRSQALLQRYIEEHPLLYAGGGICCLGELAGLLGLVLGIVGLSQERARPTRNGRTFSILGIVFGSLPLLCCVVYLIFVLVALTSGGIP
jgi:hypothetical protein